VFPICERVAGVAGSKDAAADVIAKVYKRSNWSRNCSRAYARRWLTSFPPKTPPNFS
jgi:hypothetical protein